MIGPDREAGRNKVSQASTGSGKILKKGTERGKLVARLTSEACIKANMDILGSKTQQQQPFGATTSTEPLSMPSLLLLSPGTNGKRGETTQAVLWKVSSFSSSSNMYEHM